MELGLVCAVCSQLSSLRATTCQRCGQALIVATAPSLPLAAPPVVATNSANPPVFSPPVIAPPTVAAVAPALAPAAAMPVSATAATAVPGQHFAAASSTPPRDPAAPLPPVGRTNTPAPAFAQAPVFAAAPPTNPPASSTSNPAVIPVRSPPSLSGPHVVPEAGTADPGQSRTLFFGALQQQAAQPKLVVIRGGNADGVTYTLSNPSQDIGRRAGEITFANDVFLGSPHATFSVQNGRVIVADLGSPNGVFLRIKQPVMLGHGDMFLVGEQLLQLDLTPMPDYAPDMNGTFFYGAPRPDTAFRIVQLLAGGGEGSLEHAVGTCMTIGRDGNHFDFPRDRFISGQHVRLDLDPNGDQVVLRDLGSRNGTFVRLNGPTELAHGDYLFLGQQLLRIELN